MTMIEKVVRALYADYDGGVKLGLKEIMHTTAKVGIEALRELSDAMLTDMAAQACRSDDSYKTIFQIAIDAALKE